MPKEVELLVFALQSSQTQMSLPDQRPKKDESPPKHGPRWESQTIAVHFISVFNPNLFAWTLCGFFGVKMKLFLTVIPLQAVVSPNGFSSNSSDSHFNGVKPPKMFPSVSKITVSVFEWSSHRT
jgi:hypothetical protein